MKKIFLSLICLLSISATGFSQQKGNKLSVSQAQSLFSNEDKWSLDPGTPMETNWFHQQEESNPGFNYGNVMIDVDCTLLCGPKQLFINKIIHQLFKHQF